MIWEIAGTLFGIHLISKIGEARARAKEKKEKELQRMNTPFSFSQALSKEEFEAIVNTSAKSIKRIKKIEIDGPVVRFTVRAQSGISEWQFTIDFNDFGKFTGKYWLTSENDDSSIPDTVAERIVGASLTTIEKKSTVTQKTNKETGFSQVNRSKEERNNLKRDSKIGDSSEAAHSKSMRIPGCLMRFLIITLFLIFLFLFFLFRFFLN